VSTVDRIRRYLENTRHYGGNGDEPLIDALSDVVGLWSPPDEDAGDDLMAWDEGYQEAMDEVVDVIANALGIARE
jgi:hypothetical protein